RTAGRVQPHQCPRRGGGHAHRTRLPVGALRQPGSPPGRRHGCGTPPGRGLKSRNIRRMDVFTLHRGSVPLLLSLPHDGSEIPPSLAARMTDAARRAPDTDWHVSRLYDFARGLDASVLVPRFSRYVVDLNRPPVDTSLYPGPNTTGPCPAVRFSGEPV